MSENHSNNALIPIDVICQHNADGELKPLRIRIQDDEGEYQNYTIQDYRPLDINPNHATVDGVIVSVYDLVFECNIIVFGRKRTFRLYYNLKSTEPIWRINKSAIMQ